MQHRPDDPIDDSLSEGSYVADDDNEILCSYNIQDGGSSNESQQRIFKRRWLMLFIFSLNCIGNSINFTSMAGISDIASIYYDVRPTVLNWIPNCFLLIYVFVALPSAYIISSLGLRISVILCSSFNAISCSLHFAGCERNGFAYIMAGQISAAIAVGAVLQIPAKLATVWFGVNEHATATSIGYLVNILGMAVGYLQSTQMVPNDPENLAAVAKGIYYMNLSQMIFCLIALVLTYIVFQDHPPLPPSNLLTSVNEGHNKVPPFMTCIRLLVEDRDFNLYTQGFSICFGIFAFYSIVLNEMVSFKMKEGDIGWMGFSCNIAGLINMLICGLIVDKYKCYKGMSIFLVAASLIDWIAFTLVLLLTDYTIVLFVLYTFLGLFTIPLTSVGVVQGSVTTYPVPEETSGGIMLIIGNLYGFVFVFFLGGWVTLGKIGVVCYITIGLLTAALIFVSVSRVNLKKFNSENTIDVATGSMNQVA